jgi:N-alpha-acetyltransferase 50
MLQSSITAWLKKPASVLKHDQNATPQNKQQDGSAIPPPQPSRQNDERGQPPEPPAQSPQNSATPTPHISQSPSLRPLPPNVELVPLTEDLLPSWKRLNAISFPISYPPQFYNETLEDPTIHSLTLIALWHSDPSNKPRSSLAPSSTSTTSSESNPPVIGAIRCRILDAPTPCLYISTLSLLAPYRSFGIATHMLQRVMVKGVQDYGIRTVMAHVWEMNEEALVWYKKRGFEMVGKEEGYYRKLRPGGALLMQKTVGVSDLLKEDSGKG